MQTEVRWQCLLEVERTWARAQSPGSESQARIKRPSFSRAKAQADKTLSELFPGAMAGSIRINRFDLVLNKFFLGSLDH